MFCGIFPELDMAFLAGMIIIALIAIGITGPEFNTRPTRK